MAAGRMWSTHGRFEIGVLSQFAMYI